MAPSQTLESIFSYLFKCCLFRKPMPLRISIVTLAGIFQRALCVPMQSTNTIAGQSLTRVRSKEEAETKYDEVLA